MRKRITPAVSMNSALEAEHWINLEGLAEIEVTSEDADHPVEAALLPGSGREWRAAEPGKQTIRILFDSPQELHTIHLVFTEERQARTQEFVLRWTSATDSSTREVVRQQYNFTPISSEVERYAVALRAVKMLELEITPALSGEAFASLTELRLA